MSIEPIDTFVTPIWCFVAKHENFEFFKLPIKADAINAFD